MIDTLNSKMDIQSVKSKKINERKTNLIARRTTMGNILKKKKNNHENIEDKDKQENIRKSFDFRKSSLNDLYKK